MTSFFTRGTARRGMAVAASCVVAGAAALPGSAGVVRAQTDCGNGAVVIVAGTNDVAADGSMAPSQIGVEQRYTGKKPNGQPDPNSPYAGANAYRVLKPEFPTTLWPAGAVGFDDDVARGTASTLQQIEKYQQDCPGKPVVVAGYSQGARVAGDILNQVGTAHDTDGDGVVTVKGPDGVDYTIDRREMSGELYSDPRRDGPESGRGIELSLAGIVPGATMSGPREGGFGDLDVVSYCLEGDPICDLPDPLHDPFGALDGLVGYFTKHGYYPWRMYAPVANGGVWNCDAELSSGTPHYRDCVVAAPSAVSGVRQDFVNQVRAALGMSPRTVVDLWGMLPNLNGVFPHANLSDLQKHLNPVMGLLPPLPNLGYGAYLPDGFLFSDLFEALMNRDADGFVKNLTALGRSAASIALLPVNFTGYWAKVALDAVRSRQTAGSPGATPFSAASDDAMDEPATGRADEPATDGADEAADTPASGTAPQLPDTGPDTDGVIVPEAPSSSEETPDDAAGAGEQETGQSSAEPDDAATADPAPQPQAGDSGVEQSGAEQSDAAPAEQPDSEPTDTPN